LPTPTSLSTSSTRRRRDATNDRLSDHQAQRRTAAASLSTQKIRLVMLKDYGYDPVLKSLGKMPPIGEHAAKAL
jgi:hypothetical protein